MQPDGRLEAPEENEPGALEPAMIDDVLSTLFGALPAPIVMALRENGAITEMPAGIPITAEQAITGVTSALEICMTGDFDAIEAAWYRMHKLRGAQVAVHLRSDPEHAVTLHFVDARRRYGVYLGFIVGSNGTIIQEQSEVFRPRNCTIRRDERSVVQWVDAATTKILGWSAEELVGQRTVGIIHPDDHRLAVANWIAMLGRPGGDHRVSLRYRHRDGEYIWFEMTHSNRLSDPAYGDVLSQMTDISERMKAIEALRASEQLLRRLTEALPLGVLQIDVARRIVYRNERASGILDVAPAESVSEQFVTVAPSDRPAFETALDALFARGEPADLEISFTHEDQRRRCSVGMRPLSSDSGAVTGAIICIGDITERVRMREELEVRAKFDNLTHCHNRASILDALEAVLKGLDRRAPGMAVLFIDLDRFKQVNDRYGHATGDELLKHTGERLLRCVRSIDIVGRLGGDEFLIVCPDVASPEAALEIARRIGATLAERVELSTISLMPASSIGVAWTAGRIDTDALVASADAAMYESKRGGHEPVLRVALAS